MSGNTSYFMNPQVADSFGTVRPDDEGMHRAERDRVSDPALVETVFCGFSIPEADVHCLNYIWLHPNLRLMSGGAWAWKGFKRTQLEAELFDMRDFIPDRAITDDGGDLLDVTLPNGYRYQVLKPFEQIRMSYEDPSRGNAMDVTATAVMPPAMLPSNRHFDQVMRTSGTLTLRGEEFRVDGFSVRDRSWGEARTENPAGMSGIHWLVAIFGDDYAIHVTGLEEPETAQWRDRFAEGVGLSRAMNRGWVWQNGRLHTVISAHIETEWDFAGRHQVAHRVVALDETGTEHRMHGQIRAAANWHTWSNVHMSIGLARWECNGRVGHGDSQVAMWTDFVRAAFGDSA
jgi:hypothetical protein